MSSQTIAYSRVIHLSHPIHPQIPQWPDDPAIALTPVAQIETTGYYLRQVAIGEHSATHMNAPKSFHTAGVGIDAYPAESLVVPAVVINCCVAAAADPDYVLTLEAVLAWEAHHTPIAAGSLVILYTGWQDRWPDPEAFFNRDASGQAHFPGFGQAALQFLLDHRQIAGIGIDTHGVDPGWDQNFGINTQVLAAPRIVLENLTQLDQLPAQGATVVIGILRLVEGSGSPAAVLALIP